MFVQEAKLVANLVHENIVQIYQLGKIPEGYYIVKIGRASCRERV